MDAHTKRVVALVIERAEQACRYVVKHSQLEHGPYRDGFESAGEVCEGAIKAQVMRHIEADIAGPYTPEEAR